MSKEQFPAPDSTREITLTPAEQEAQIRVVVALNRARNPAAYDDLMGDSGQYVVPEVL